MSDASLFEEDLHAALRVAARAPSSHNTQPWAVAQLVPAAKGDQGELLICLDRSRCLAALPVAHHLEMHLSCGAYMEALVTALIARGWRVDVEAGAMERASRSLSADWEVLARVRVAGVAQPTDREVAARRCDAALRRATVRAPFRAAWMPSGVIDAVTRPRAFALPGGATGEARWHLLDDSERIERAADFVGRHGTVEFTHDEAWTETYRCIRFADAHAASDGMPVTNLLGPMPVWRRSLMRLMLAPAVMRRLGATLLAKPMAREIAALVRATPALVYGHFPGPEADLGARLAAGAELFAVWVEAAARGFSLHPVSVVLQHDELREALREELDLPAGRAFFFARLGEPEMQVEPTPRRRPGVDGFIRLPHVQVVKEET